jgi:hypothetical protein
MDSLRILTEDEVAAFEAGRAILRDRHPEYYTKLGEMLMAAAVEEKRLKKAGRWEKESGTHAKRWLKEQTVLAKKVSVAAAEDAIYGRVRIAVDKMGQSLADGKVLADAMTVLYGEAYNEPAKLEQPEQLEQSEQPTPTSPPKSHVELTWEIERERLRGAVRGAELKRAGFGPAKSSPLQKGFFEEPNK